MRTIAICDRTLWEAGARADCPVSFKEKLEIAKLLGRLRVDVIETGAISNPTTDPVLIRTLGALVGECTLSCPAGYTEAEVETAFSAMRGVKRPRLCVRVPVSTVGMEYTFHKKPDQALEQAMTLVRKAAALGAQVEFSAEDATRAEFPFLCRALQEAVANGAQVVSLCDTAGTMLPSEFGAFLGRVRESVPELAQVHLGVRCSNALNMSVACAMEAVAAGADEVGTAVGFPSCPSLRAVAQAFAARGDSMGVRSGLVMTELRRATQQIRAIVDPQRERSPYTAASAHSEGVTLARGADISQVGAAVRSLGYELSDDDLTKVYEAFTRAASKAEITSKELDAIVATVSLQVPPTYRLVSYVMNSGNTISATANLTLERKGETLHGLSCGDGPIDAVFLAMEQILGYRYELDDFQIQAVTEGREALGEALVKLRYNGMLYAGRGISTDIIGASIMAYLNALNKIVYEGNNA